MVNSPAVVALAAIATLSITSTFALPVGPGVDPKLAGKLPAELREKIGDIAAAQKHKGRLSEVNKEIKYLKPLSGSAAGVARRGNPKPGVDPKLAGNLPAELREKIGDIAAAQKHKGRLTEVNKQIKYLKPLSGSAAGVARRELSRRGGPKPGVDPKLAGNLPAELREKIGDIAAAQKHKSRLTEVNKDIKHLKPLSGPAAGVARREWDDFELDELE